MADSNNEPGWSMEDLGGNGRSFQENNLPKGARTSSPSGNAPKTEGGKEGNGYAPYDPRSASFSKPAEEKWGASGDGADDRSNPYQEDAPVKESNALNNDHTGDHGNPHRGAMKKEWAA